MSFATANLKEAGVGLGVLVLIVAIMARIVQTIHDQDWIWTNESNHSEGITYVDEYSYNITSDGLDSFATFGDWFSVIVIVLIATVVIALLTFGFGAGRE